jgi:hypothetical protein
MLIGFLGLWRPTNTYCESLGHDMTTELIESQFESERKR